MVGIFNVLENAAFKLLRLSTITKHTNGSIHLSNTFDKLSRSLSVEPIYSSSRLPRTRHHNHNFFWHLDCGSGNCRPSGLLKNRSLDYPDIERCEGRSRFEFRGTVECDRSNSVQFQIWLGMKVPHIHQVQFVGGKRRMDRGDECEGGGFLRSRTGSVRSCNRRS